MARAWTAAKFAEGMIEYKYYSRSSSSLTHTYYTLRLVLFVASILAVVFSLLVVASCDFIEFVATPTNSTDATPIEFSFGQFRYQANNSGCLKIDDNDINIDWTFWTGRVSTAIALICAGVACLIILVEFICCRFKFSRCALSTLFSIAILGMALAFLMFASNVWCVNMHAMNVYYVVLYCGTKSSPCFLQHVRECRRKKISLYSRDRILVCCCFYRTIFCHKHHLVLCSTTQTHDTAFE